MKVKSLLLSMCAVAALAGCSQNDDEISGVGSDAPEAKVVIKVEGTGNQPGSRAAGLPSNDELSTKNSKVNNLTVFVFNGSGNVIAKKYFGTPTTGANEVATTTDAKEVAVVTNTGDQTGAGNLFATVSSKSALKAVLADMLQNPDDPTGPVSQKDDNVYMSGTGVVGTFADDNGTMKATVSVSLKYLAARVQLKEISFNGKTVSDNSYVQAGSFDASTTANFTIRRVYLMNVQRATHFLPATDGGTDYMVQGDKIFAGGVAWAAPWGDNNNKPNGYAANNEYTIEAGTDKFTATTNKISDIGHWYTFANTGVSEIANHPTALVVEVTWRKTQAAAGVDKEDQTLYFTTYFGGGDQAELEPGKVYTVNIKLNGNFKPSGEGGSGGGGTEDPTKPTVNSAIEVTVTPASWTLEPDINKEWT